MKPKWKHWYRIDKENLAWLAGFFDGEGCTGTIRNSRTHMAFTLQILQKYRSLLDQVYHITKKGHISGPYATGRSGPIYRYAISNFADSQFTVGLIWTWLSRRKKGQYIKAARRYLKYSRGLSQHPIRVRSVLCQET